VIEFKVFQRTIKSAIFFIFIKPGEKGVSAGLGAIERSLGLTEGVPGADREPEHEHARLAHGTQT